MDAAVKRVLKSMFDEYVVGLDNTEASLPMTLRNLVLKEKKVNEDLEDTPFVLDNGRIGQIIVSPGGWMGSVEVKATNVVLNLSWSAQKAMKLAMRPQYKDDLGDVFLTEGFAPTPPPPVPPRYCPKHDSSEKRQKTEPRSRECASCHMTITTSYADVKLCPPCSEKEKRCMICGAAADKAGHYLPPAEIAKRESTTGAKDLPKASSRPAPGTVETPFGGLGLSFGTPFGQEKAAPPPEQRPPAATPDRQTRPPWQGSGGAPGPGYAPRGAGPGPGPGPSNGPGGPRGPHGPQQGRPGPPQEDESFLGFLRSLVTGGVNCGTRPDEEDDYYEMKYQPAVRRQGVR